MTDILALASEAIKRRREQYGQPEDNFKAIADMWSVILGIEVTSKQVGLMMVALKIARDMHNSVLDDYTDMAGYAQCLADLEFPSLPAFTNRTCGKCVNKLTVVEASWGDFCFKCLNCERLV